MHRRSWLENPYARLEYGLKHLMPGHYLDIEPSIIINPQRFDDDISNVRICRSDTGHALYIRINQLEYIAEHSARYDTRETILDEWNILMPQSETRYLCIVQRMMRFIKDEHIDEKDTLAKYKFRFNGRDSIFLGKGIYRYPMGYAALVYSSRKTRLTYLTTSIFDAIVTRNEYIRREKLPCQKTKIEDIDWSLVPHEERPRGAIA